MSRMLSNSKDRYDSALRPVTPENPIGSCCLILSICLPNFIVRVIRMLQAVIHVTTQAGMRWIGSEIAQDFDDLLEQPLLLG